MDRDRLLLLQQEKRRISFRSESDTHLLTSPPSAAAFSSDPPTATSNFTVTATKSLERAAGGTRRENTTSLDCPYLMLPTWTVLPQLASVR